MFIITGGGSGLGKALAHSLASRGKSVLIVGRRLEPLKETGSFSPLIDFLCADISTPEGIQLVVRRVADIAQITALINNAGSLQPIAPLRELEGARWHKTLSTNLDAALFLPQKLYKQLINGRVLNIGSGAAYFAIKGWATYCVSKAALSMLTKCWQLESEQVAFASVMPGIADTDMQALAREAAHMDSEQTNFYKNLKHNNRLVSSETVAEFLTWILLEVDNQTYQSKEWDIYDTSHHAAWLRAPHEVPHWEG
ncbi:SDR family NAD(P)-dependent oxidoreductase [Legionella sp. km772]|uniref:SDR family NAD(P)-dependent oxidoreductase n=1 Tax=Legionella sp. km772 TaxID=2498111 RepID=UPI000F8C7FCA|nr:SDR family NAD(P)-dependent oxidoreductase [Legionella sp. km772]RUR11162.1 SDR family NAD(P)-dependent oxidoreductase [Legionella sp. km772]